jgi:hypothetical protein
MKALGYIAVALVAAIITYGITYAPPDGRLMHLAERQNAMLLQLAEENEALRGYNAALADSLTRVKAQYARRPYVAQRRQLDSLSAPLDSIRTLAQRFAR